MTLFLQLLAVAGLLLLNAFFVAAEYALVTARRTRLTELRDQGDRRARTVLRITANPSRFIAAMQLGVTITSLGIGAVGEQVFARIFDPILAAIIAYGLAFLLITYLHVVIGELIPKGIALGHAETVALAVSTPVRGFFFVFKPLIWVLEKSSNWALHVLGLEAPGEDRGSPYSEAELKGLELRAKELQAQQAKLAEERDRMAAAVPEDELALFRRVAKLRGAAVGPAVESMCTLCHLKLRPQMWVDLKLTDQVIQCPGCSRILYYEAPIPEVHPQP